VSTSEAREPEPVSAGRLSVTDDALGPDHQEQLEPEEAR
jgi:hypothetical protein